MHIHLLRHCLIFTWLLVQSVAGADVATAETRVVAWKEVNNKGGILVYIGEAQDTPIVKAKGIVTIDATTDEIVAVLDDNANHTKWVPYLLESRKLEAISDSERLEYNLFDAPWPASRRDFVFRVIAEEMRDGLNGIVFRVRSEPSSLMPDQDGVIRGALLESTFRLIELEPRGTRVELIFQADPRGWIPVWIVNLVQRIWPYTVLTGLRNQVASGK